MAIVPKDDEFDWIDFDGDDDCSDDCRGWNGKDYRCDCGSYRVCFECFYGGCGCDSEEMMDCSNAYAVTH